MLRPIAILLGLALGLVLAACDGQASAADIDIQMRVEFDPRAQIGPVECEVELVDASGRPLSGADLEIEGNMNHAGMVPVVAEPEEVAPGRYCGPFEFTMGGDWLITVRGTLADGRRLERTTEVRGVSRPLAHEGDASR